MKKILFTTVLLLLLAASFTFGQAIQKGNLIGIHVLTIELKPGVTMEQLVTFYNNKYFPAVKKHLGTVGYIGSSIRGTMDIKDKLVLIWQMESPATRDKFFINSGFEWNELGQQALEKLKPVTEELDKLVTITKDEWADWLIK
ncbi:MAG: hypothetical protein ACK4TA_24095 [Saprospiraceae bacterium]